MNAPENQTNELLRFQLELKKEEIVADNVEIAKLREENERQDKTLDWAETLLCNALPMSHCTQEEWDAIIKKWRDEKHGVATEALSSREGGAQTETMNKKETK